MVIRKKEDFVVDGLGRVSVYTAISPEVAGTEKQPLVLYEGFAILGANSNGQLMQVPVEFALDATSLDDAFAKFQQAATERFKEMMEEARKQAEAQANRIVVPQAPLPKKIVME